MTIAAARSPYMLGSIGSNRHAVLKTLFIEFAHRLLRAARCFEERLGADSGGLLAGGGASRTVSPRRWCLPETSSARSALWKTCVASFRLKPIGEKAAMTLFGPPTVPMAGGRTQPPLNITIRYAYEGKAATPPPRQVDRTRLA